MEKPESKTLDSARYIETIIRQRGLIITTFFLMVIFGLIFSLTLPKRYKSAALIATTKVTSTVSLGSPIQTTSEEQILANGTGSFGMIDRTARLQTYVQLIDNPEIAQYVLDRLADKLDPEYHNIRSLLRIVTGSIAGRSDLIKIEVSYKDPVVAAEIANAWAQAYIEIVNPIYAEADTRGTFEAIQRELVNAKKTYEAAQSVLENDLRVNRINELTRQVERQQAILDRLALNYTDVISSVVILKSEASVKAISENLTDLQSKLENAYDRRRQFDRALQDVQIMREQVEQGGDGAAKSNSLALTLLKTQIFSSQSEISNLQVQINIDNYSAAEMLPDLDGLIIALRSRRQQIDSEIEDYSEQLISLQNSKTAQGFTDQSQAILSSISNLDWLFKTDDTESNNILTSDALQFLEQQVRELNAQLEQEMSRQNDLIRARDLAWEMFKSLATKEAELVISLQTSGSVVTLASPASVPDQDEVSVAKNTAIAGIIGLVLGLISAYGIEFWWAYKGIDATPVIAIRRNDHRN